MNSISKIWLALFLVALITGCGGSAEPTKEQLISDLKSVHKLLAAGDNMAAVEYFKTPDEMPKEKLAREMGGFLKKNEISSEGIEILDQKGKFGKLMEVFPERGGKWMARNKLSNPEECYGLGYQNAEVAAWWTGTKFQLIRLDDVGKLN